MGDFKINEKTVFTQSGSAEPAMGSTVTDIPAAGVTGVLPVGVTGGSGLNALGTVTAGNLSNTAIVYPAGHTLKYQSYALASDISVNDTAAWQTIFDVAFSPTGGAGNNTKIYGQMMLWLNGWYSGVSNSRKDIFMDVIGDDITNSGYTRNSGIGVHDYGASGTVLSSHFLMGTPPVTLNGTGNADIQFTIKIRSGSANSDSGIDVFGDSGANTETYLLIWEVQ